MTRHEGDYYPTPPCAVDALLRAVSDAFVPELSLLYERRVPALDPAAGAGTLLSWGAPQGCKTHAIELNPILAEQCRIRGHETIEGDALAIEPAREAAGWPGVPLMLLNPPNVLLAEFVRKALRHALYYGSIACVLHPSQWSQTAEQAGLPVGDKVELTWRPPFIPKGTISPKTGKLVGGPGQTYVWEIWTPAMVRYPRASGRYMRVTRPPEDKARVEEHARIAGAIGRLGIGTEGEA